MNKVDSVALESKGQASDRIENWAHNLLIFSWKLKRFLKGEGKAVDTDIASYYTLKRFRKIY